MVGPFSLARDHGAEAQFVEALAGDPLLSHEGAPVVDAREPDGAPVKGGVQRRCCGAGIPAIRAKGALRPLLRPSLRIEA